MMSSKNADVEYLRLRLATLQTQFDARGEELAAVKAKLFGLQGDAAHTHVQLGKINSSLQAIEERLCAIEDEL